MIAFMNIYRHKKVLWFLSTSRGDFNIVQLALASILVKNMILFRGYLPFLLLLAVPTGFFTGLATIYLEKVARHAGLQIEEAIEPTLTGRRDG